MGIVWSRELYHCQTSCRPWCSEAEKSPELGEGVRQHQGLCPPTACIKLWESQKPWESCDSVPCPRAPTLLPGSWGRCGRRKDNGFLAVPSSHTHLRKPCSLAHPHPWPLRHTPILGELWALCPLDKFWSLRNPRPDLAFASISAPDSLYPEIIAQLFIKIVLSILFHAVWRRLSPFIDVSSHNESEEDHEEEGLWVPVLYSCEGRWS